MQNKDNDLTEVIKDRLSKMNYSDLNLLIMANKKRKNNAFYSLCYSLIQKQITDLEIKIGNKIINKGIMPYA